MNKNRLRTIKKYFNDARLERAFMKLMVQVDIYNRPIAIALINLSETEIMELKMFYNGCTYNRLLEKLQNDIEYILELE